MHAVEEKGVKILLLEDCISCSNTPDWKTLVILKTFICWFRCLISMGEKPRNVTLQKVIVQ